MCRFYPKHDNFIILSNVGNHSQRRGRKIDKSLLFLRVGEIRVRKIRRKQIRLKQVCRRKTRLMVRVRVRVRVGVGRLKDTCFTAKLSYGEFS